MQTFSVALTERAQQHFWTRHGVRITTAEAAGYLYSLADLFLAFSPFQQSDAFSATPKADEEASQQLHQSTT